jgi:hypothetical protein
MDYAYPDHLPQDKYDGDIGLRAPWMQETVACTVEPEADRDFALVAVAWMAYMPCCRDNESWAMAEVIRWQVRRRPRR